MQISLCMDLSDSLVSQVRYQDYDYFRIKGISFDQDQDQCDCDEFVLTLLNTHISGFLNDVYRHRCVLLWRGKL